MSVPTVAIRMILPKPPNFIRIEGFEGALDVGDLDADTLRAFGEAWVKQFLEHAASRSKISPEKRAARDQIEVMGPAMVAAIANKTK